MFNYARSTVSFGRSHGAAVTVDGELFSWGDTNSQGQLGLARTRSPSILLLPPSSGSISEQVKDNDTVVVDISDAGSGGQAATPPAVAAVLWRPALPVGLRVLQVACGHHHTLCVTKGTYQASPACMPPVHVCPAFQCRLLRHHSTVRGLTQFRAMFQP